MGQLDYQGSNKGISESSIRRIVQEELKRSQGASRFQINSIPNHSHNGVDSLQIKQENIVPSLNTAGSITMGTQGATYTINLTSNFTPSNILAYGVVTDQVTDGIRCHTIGSAQLTNGFYLQPESSRSVKMGGPEYPFPTAQPDGTDKTVPIQGSSFMYCDDPNDEFKAGVSEDHLVDVYVGSAISDIRARVTVVDFSKTSVKLYVPYLETNWRIIVNYVIT